MLAGGWTLVRGGDRQRRGAALIEACLLCAAVPLLDGRRVLGLAAAACACGLQNAMVSAYSGATVRTTHVSGIFADLGIFLGHELRVLPVDSRRLRLCVLIILGFLCGGIAGAAAFRQLGNAALFIPNGLTVLTALAYAGYGIAQTSRLIGSPAVCHYGSTKIL